MYTSHWPAPPKTLLAWWCLGGVCRYALLSGRAFINHFKAGYDLWSSLPSSYIDWRLPAPLGRTNLSRPAPGRAVIDYYDPLLNGKVWVRAPVFGACGPCCGAYGPTRQYHNMLHMKC